MKRPTLTHSPGARGFTLVEILVALTIGMVLTLVVAQLFLGSRRTYATTDEVSRMQENIRFTYQLLTRTIHMGGYKSSPNTKVDQVFTVATPVLVGLEGASPASDSFTVSFQGNTNGTALDASGNPLADGTVVDCQGVAIGAGVMSTNTFTIKVSPRSGRNALFCHNGTLDQEIIPDVENMQVLYGVDNNTDLIVDTYMPANLIANMNNVRSVRVALLFTTPAEVLPAPQVSGAPVAPATGEGPLNLNGVEFGPYTDRRVRRAVTFTVNMRNRTP